jgi:hypothetical protein
MDTADERALRILDRFARLPREVRPVTLTEQYLAHIARVEALPQNQSGTDKTTRHRGQAEFRNHYRRAQRP